VRDFGDTGFDTRRGRIAGLIEIATAGSAGTAILADL
jgi:hypothetical protein